jgi:predicted Zn-dependent protease
MPSISTDSDDVTDYRAQFNDGETAASHAVTVRPQTDALVIISEDGPVLGRWPWKKIRLIETVTPGRPIRLTNRDKPNANLTIVDPSIFPTLEAFAPFLRREPFDRQRILTAASIVAAVALLIGIFVYGPPLLAKPLAKVVPVSWEDDIGEQTARIVHRMFADGETCNDPDGVAALEALTARLAGSANTRYQLHVTVADTPVINALALPGGRIIVFRGLIENVESAEAVAGVLAHELAHVTLRHPTQGLIVSIGWSAMLSALSGGASGSSNAIAQVAAELATSAYSRDVEAEADSEGVAILERAGINGRGLIAFFNMVKKLSSHPLTDRRITAIKSASGGEGGPAMSQSDWTAVKDICD